jgi:hypothetical protein
LVVERGFGGEEVRWPEGACGEVGEVLFLLLLPHVSWCVCLLWDCHFVMAEVGEVDVWMEDVWMRDVEPAVPWCERVSGVYSRPFVSIIAGLLALFGS